MLALVCPDRSDQAPDWKSANCAQLANSRLALEVRRVSTAPAVICAWRARACLNHVLVELMPTKVFSRLSAS
jgi:hypothetical protein